MISHKSGIKQNSIVNLIKQNIPAVQNELSGLVIIFGDIRLRAAKSQKKRPLQTHREHRIVRLRSGQRHHTTKLPNGFTEPFGSVSFCTDFGLGLYLVFI